MINHKDGYSRREISAIRAAILLGMLGFISLNMYLPSIPAIAQEFHIKMSQLKISITLFLVGFSISQFYWGSLSSKYGRKKVIILGLLFSSIGTIWVLFSHSLWEFNCSRFIEGFGIGCASVLYRTLLADSLPPNKLSHILFIIISVSNIMPALAPLIGGYFELFFGWRAIFILLLVYTFILGVIIRFNTAETNAAIRKDLTLKHAILEYIQVFKNRRFIGYVAPYLALSSGIIGYYTVTPFIFITYLHIAPHYYSYLLLFTVAMYIVGGAFARKIREKIGFNGTILVGASCSFAAAALLFGLSFFSQLSVINITIPMMFYIFGCGLVAPNSNTCALTELRHIAGASSAVIGSSVYALAAICSTYISHLDLSRLLSLGVYMLSLSFIGLLVFYFLIIRHLNEIS